MRKSLLAVFLLFACTGSQLAMQIADPPIYVCPTGVVNTPMPLPTYIVPPGYPTLVAFPTAIPLPSGTPYIIRPPQPFYLGDAVFAGGWSSPNRVRFRLLSVTSNPATPLGTTPRSVHVWQLEIKNVGTTTYEVFPAWQSYVSRIETPFEASAGIWGASRDAALEVGLPADFAAITLVPGSLQIFEVAAYGPEGSVKQITFVLDPTTDPAVTPLPGTPRPPGVNPLVWTTDLNPSCSSDIADPPVGVLPPP